MNPLPRPEIPFTDWAQFLTACWTWGLRHVDEELLHKRLEHAYGEMTRKRDSEALDLLRPSKNLDCAMKTYLSLRNNEADAEDLTHMLQTFNVGHLLHAHAFAQVESALPPGFAVDCERRVDLVNIGWWPQDPQVARQSGSADMVLECLDDDAAAKYFGDNAVNDFCLIDFKSAADHTHKRHKQGGMEDKADPFGSFSQLAVYQGALGFEGDAVLAMINRNILSGVAPLAARLIGARFLAEELARVEKRVTDPQPIPEKLRVWGGQVGWYCQGGKNPAWCGRSVECSEFWDV